MTRALMNHEFELRITNDARRRFFRRPITEDELPRERLRWAWGGLIGGVLLIIFGVAELVG
jgi:hypothetical protein